MKPRQQQIVFTQKVDELFTACASLLQQSHTRANKRAFGALVDILYMYNCNEREAAKQIRAKYWMQHSGSTASEKWMYTTTLNPADEKRISHLANEIVQFIQSDAFNFRLINNYPHGEGETKTNLYTHERANQKAEHHY